MPDKHPKQPRHRRETTARWRGQPGTRVFGIGSAPAWRRSSGGRWVGLPPRGPRPHADQRDSSPHHPERVTAGTVCHDGRQGASKQPLETRLAGQWEVGNFPLGSVWRQAVLGRWAVSVAAMDLTSSSRPRRGTIEMASSALGYVTASNWRPGRRRCSVLEHSPRNSRRGDRRRSVRRMKTKIFGGIVTIGVFPRRRRTCRWGFARGSPSRWWGPVKFLGEHPDSCEALGSQRYEVATRTGRDKTRLVSRNARERGSRYWGERKTQRGLLREQRRAMENRFTDCDDGALSPAAPPNSDPHP